MTIPDDSEFCPFCGSKIITVTSQTEVNNSLLLFPIDSLIKRAFFIIEEGDYAKAAHFIEHILNREPENAEAYLARLLIDLKLKTIDDLQNLKINLNDNINYKRTIKFANDELREKMRLLETNIAKNKSTDSVEDDDDGAIERKYQSAVEIYQREKPNRRVKVRDYQEALFLLSDISNYKESTTIIEDVENYLEYYKQEKQQENFAKAFLVFLGSFLAIVVTLVAIFA